LASDIPYRPATVPVRLDLALLLARVALVLLFPISGFYKILQWPGIVGVLTQQGAPMPFLGGVLAVAAETILPVLLVLGLYTRWAALGLILYTLGTNVIAHRFWELTGGAQFGQMMSFFKNISLIAGLALIMVLGPGRYALRPSRVT
jgi:putative oxidoreductase